MQIYWHDFIVLLVWSAILIPAIFIKSIKFSAEANYQVEITNARAIRDKNKIIGEGVTESLLKLRALEVQEAMAENGSAVFMPFEAMSTVGAQNRIYGK